MFVSLHRIFRSEATRHWLRISGLVGGLLLFSFIYGGSGDVVRAISSTNYKINEDSLGNGGSGTTGASNSYQVQDSVGGSAGIGDSSSTNFQTKSGPVTTDDPNLSVSLNTSSVALGALQTSLTRTGTANFTVLNYTSYGYIVQIIGSPPSNGARTLQAMSTNAASAAGTEQFGINLVANTSPTTLGADPVQTPNATFSFGTAAANYNTANSYRYVAGETIASAPKSSGTTSYTMSYIANIGINTPGGSYSGNQTIVVVGTY